MRVGIIDKHGISRTLPAWMTASEPPATIRDSDAFIDRSLQALAATLAALRRSGASRPIQTGDAAVRLYSAIMAVLLLSLSRGSAFTLLYGTALLVLLATRRAAVIATVLKSAILAALISLTVLLPAFFLGYGTNGPLISLKIFCSVSTMALVASETRWEALFESLALIRVSALLILILDITLKYITVLGEYALNLLRALKLRSVGKNKNKRASLSGIAGTLFLRSGRMAWTLHQAMECRGFTGSYVIHHRLRFGIETPLFVGLDSLLIAAFILWGRP